MPRKPATTLPAFTPVPRKSARHDGWTPERQQGFIEKLADCGSVRAAANAMGMTPESAYQLRRAPEAGGFAKAWKAALDLGIARVEDVAMDRALNGTEAPVYSYGKLVGTRTVFNDRLLMFMLRNRAPRRFAAGGASGLSAVDRTMLARMKKEWRREWERERFAAAAAEREGQTSYLEQLGAKLKLMAEREVETRLMLERDAYRHRGQYGDGDGGDGDGDEEDWQADLPADLRRNQPTPRARTFPEEDDGWNVVRSYDELYGDAADSVMAEKRAAAEKAAADGGAGDPSEVDGAGEDAVMEDGAKEDGA